MNKLPLIFYGLICLLPTTAAWAATTVRACDADTQSGAGTNLQQALATGGTIVFACPNGTSLRVHARHSVPADTVIDGGDAVTLDGHGLAGPFITSLRGRLVVKNIAMRRFTLSPTASWPGRALGRVGGAVLRVGGNAQLERVTIEGSVLPVTVDGHLIVTDSMFRANSGSAVVGGESTTVKRSTFLANEVGLSFQRGRVDDSSFISNTKIGIRLTAPSGPLSIRHSSFQHNALGLELSNQAAFGVVVPVAIRSNRFEDNTGGAIASFDLVQQARDRGSPAASSLARLPQARYVLAYDRFLRNRGARGAAIDADLRTGTQMTVVGGLFIENSATGEGGAIAVRGGELRVSHSLFRANRSAAPGPAIRAVSGTTGRIELSNSLVVENVGPGAAIDAHAISLTNVTVARNEAKGLAVRAVSSVANSILSENKAGNCMGLAAQAFRGPNLQFGVTDCPGVAIGNPFLDTLYVPALGSPALRLGDAAICRALPVRGADMLFQLRPGTTCALGAHEGPPLRIARQHREARPAAPPENRR